MILKKVPSIDSADVRTYGESFIDTLYGHFGVLKAATTLDGADCTKEPIISDETIIEWKNYTIDASLLNIPKRRLPLNFKS